MYCHASRSISLPPARASHSHDEDFDSFSDMCAMQSDGDDMDSDHSSGMTRAIQESIDRAFGKNFLEDMMDSDGKSDEPKPVS